MKKSIRFIVGASFFLAGCSTYCDNQFAAGMLTLLPDLSGKTFVYTNARNDTLHLVCKGFGVAADEEIENCSKCSCSGEKANYGFDVIGPEGIAHHAWFELWGYKERGRYEAYYFDSENNSFSRSDLEVSFDNHGNILSRNFGDTLILTNLKQDTAIWVLGFGLIRLNEFRLFSPQTRGHQENKQRHLSYNKKH